MLSPNLADTRVNRMMPALPGPVLSPISLIGVPFGAGAGLPGCEDAPQALRRAGLGALLREAGRTIAVEGDVSFETRLQLLHPLPPARFSAEVAAAIRATDRASSSALGFGEMPLVLGGDHSVSMGSVAAASRNAARRGRRLALLWIDAHADFNTPETSPSGNLHGMSVAHLMGEPTLAPLGASPFPAIRAQDVLLFGLRSVDRGEQMRLDAAGIASVSAQEAGTPSGLARLDNWLDRMRQSGADLHVSLDLDVLDPTIMPAVGTPVDRGLTFEALEEALARIARNAPVSSADLVEFNPHLDPDGSAAACAMRLILRLLGTPFQHKGV